MAHAEDALIGLTSLLILLANYGLYRWFGGHGLDDKSHRSPIVAAALGSLMATDLVLISGPGPAAYVAGIVPWLMVSFFTYPESKGVAVVSGILAWGVWWGITGLTRFFVDVNDALAL